jgi:hypothetical protein
MYKKAKDLQLQFEPLDYGEKLNDSETKKKKRTHYI